NRALNQIRVEEMNKIRYTRPRDYRKLKQQWKLILKNESDLNYEDFFTHRLYEGMVSEYVMVEYLLSISPRLRKSYDLVNRLKWALKKRRFDRFEEVLNKAKEETDRKSTRLNSSHVSISYAVFCLKIKNNRKCNTSHSD